MDFFSTKIAYAADVDKFVHDVNQMIINPIIYVLFALAIAFFLFGVFQFLLNQDNEEKKSTGKSHMLWGIIGITIMIGVFAIMNIILRTFKIDYVQINSSNNQVTPEVKRLPN